MVALKGYVSSMEQEKMIYLVSRGCYSDYHVCAVFSSKEKAQKYLDFYKNGEWNDENEGYRIEERELDPETLQVPINLFPYKVAMSKDGEISYCNKVSYADEKQWGRQIIFYHEDYEYNTECWNEGLKNKEFMSTFVLARDGKHAVKIANERRIFLLDQDLWTTWKDEDGKDIEIMDFFNKETSW